MGEGPEMEEEAMAGGTARSRGRQRGPGGDLEEEERSLGWEDSLVSTHRILWPPRPSFQIENRGHVLAR